MSEQPSHFTVRRPVAVWMVVLAATVFGFFSYGRLPVTLMPELTYPTLTVRTEYPGAAPEEVENDVSRPVEEALGVVSGLRRISSISRAGVSDVVLELSWDTEVHRATQDVLERLDLVFLPTDAERPLILHYDPSLDPVMELSLSGAGDRFAGEEGLRRLRRLADLQVKRSLEPIKGVAAVRVRGGLEEEIHVRLDGDRLVRSGLSIQHVIDRLRQENINVAGGTIQEGRTEYMVRTLNEYQDLDQIRDTVVARRDGREVRVGDLGTVAWAHKEREILTRTDGGESVQIDVFKEADANIVALAGQVRAAIGELDAAKIDAGEAVGAPGAGGGGARRGPGGPGGQAAGLAETLYRAEGARLAVVADRSVFIESSIDEVRNTAVLGGLLAVAVLYLFLRSFKSTAIIAVSIPVSLLITFAPLNMLGVSLNIMSLGGLALGVGLLVDCSIVVLESIFRCREEGDSVVAAAVRGTAEVRGAVVASTLTTVAVFFPMVFVEGVAGEAFGDLGLAVVISLLASLAVAVWFIPMLASRRGMDLAAPAPAAERLATWSAGRDLRADLAAGWEKVRNTARRTGPARLALLPLRLVSFAGLASYLVVETLLSSIFELVGKLLLSGAAGLAWLWRRLLGPALSGGSGLLLAMPLKAAERLLEALRTGYPRVIRWALGHSAAVIALVAAVLALTFAAARGLDSELLPEIRQGEFTFEVALPVGTPLAETDAVLAPVEAAILEEAEHIRALILTVGFDAANSQRADEGEHSARFKVLLEPVELSTADRLTGVFTGAGGTAEREEEVIRRIRRRLAEIPDLEARVVRPVLFSSRTPIEVEVHGDDLAALKRYGDRVREVMAGMPELADVELSLKSGAPEVQIVYDRERLARYGLNLRQVAELVRNQVKGFEATRFNLQDRRVPVLVRLAEGHHETVESVRSTTVNPSAARPIPLAAVADVTLGEGPSEVRRVDGRRVALVEANIAEGSLGSAVAAIRSELARRVEWPAEMTFYIAGQNEEWERSRGSLYLALGLSLFLVYVIMAAQFESLLQPLVIMVTIPLAFFGSVVTLALLGISLSVVVFLGMILLAGIVVNNAIILIDYINILRARGIGRDAAIVAAGEARLRPILMTTATTVLGLAPMALGLGDGAEIRTPMALVVISGLITSTVLTLVVIPSVYSMVERLKDRLLGRSEPSAEAAGEPAREPADGLVPDAAGPAVPVGWEPAMSTPAKDTGSRWEKLLPRFSLDRRITVLVLLASTLVVGVVATLGIPIELFPRGFESPFLSVNVPWSDAPAREVMDKIVLPLEEELSTVRGLDVLNSFSATGFGRVFLRFKHGTDMDVAYREVRDRVHRAQVRMPEDADRFFIRKDSPSGFPVGMVGLAIDPALVDPYDLIQNAIVLPLSRIDGVASVGLQGLEEKEVLIELDRQRTQAAGLNIYQIAQDLGSDNFSLASGHVREGSSKLLLRSVARYGSLEEVGDRRLSPSVRVRDVAAVTYAEPDKKYRVRVNGRPAVAVQVFKEGEANTLEVSRAVVALVDELKIDPRLRLIDLDVFFDQGSVILESLETLIDSGKIGGLFAVGVLFFFLRRLRMTLIITLSIPLSMLIGLTVMYFAGESLNILTLLGLMLCVGLLVDNSVVVAENIYRMHKEGLPRREACLAGSSQVALAITMATLTTVIVFLPVSLVEGEAQFFLLRLSIPVSVSLLASLLVALVFIPLSVYLTLPENGDGREPTRLERAHKRLNAVLHPAYDATFERLNRGYERLLGFFLGRRRHLLWGVTAVVAITGAAAAARGLEVVEQDENERPGFAIEVELPANYSFADTEQFFLEIEEVLAARQEELDLDGYFFFHRTGWGEIEGWLNNPRTNDFPVRRINERLLEVLPERPGVTYYTGNEDESGDEDKTEHVITLYGDDADLLERTGADLEGVFAAVDGVVGVKRLNQERQPNELALVIDRERAQRQQVNPQVVAGVVGYALRGQSLPEIHRDGREIRVRVRFEEQDRESLAELADFEVPTEGGSLVSLASITDVQVSSAAKAIMRREKRMARTITLELEAGREDETRERLGALTRRIDLPEGIGFGDRPGRARGGNDEVAAMAFAAAVSVLFIYLLMGLLFESFILPLSIISTIPLAGIGVVWLHLLADRDIDFLGMVGLVLLIGVVVNNGIVLIDYINRLRWEGIGRREAVLLASRHRFRPIMMTALTTICGMVPLTVGGPTSIGLSYKSFGFTLIGGLTTATALTLLVVPVLYTLFDDALGVLGAAVRRGWQGPAAATGAAAELAPSEAPVA